MDDLFKPEVKKRGINPVFVIGLIAGLVVVGTAIYLLSFKPPMEEQTAKILEGSFRDGSPEFESLNKDIIISMDDDTVESPMGLGTISMFIKGKIKNKGTRNISVLEVNVSVIDTKNQPLREKRVLVVPIQQPVLAPGESIPITLTMDGFDRKDDRANVRWKVTAIKAAS